MIWKFYGQFATMWEDFLGGRDNTQENRLWGIPERLSWSLGQPLSKVALLLGIFISMTKNFLIIGNCVAWDQKASFGHTVPLAFSLVGFWHDLNMKHLAQSHGLNHMVPSWRRAFENCSHLLPGHSCHQVLAHTKAMSQHKTSLP